VSSRSLWKQVGLSLCCLSSAALAAADDCGVKNIRLGARHLEPKGIGFNDGYTTVEGFFAPPVDRYCVVPFLDMRGHLFNNGRLASNMGLGVRQLLGCRVYGVNAYWDYRNTKRHSYNQISAGLESLGTRWDFKANGYFTVGSRQSKGYHTEFEEFVGHQAIISRKYEFSMRGVDAEAGVHFAKTQNLDFYLGAGPYYFEGKGKNAWGGKAHLLGKFGDYLTLEVSESYDNVFRNIVSGQVAVMFPIGCKTVSKKRTPCCNDPCFLQTISERLVQPVGKQEIIVVDSKRRKSVAINPITALPFQFWFVDNLSSSDGTFESPFPTLALAQTVSQINDIIYVFPGDGLATGMSLGITLKNRQRLWGSGVAQSFETSLGAVSIPALSDILPSLRHTAGAVITVANNNEISGLLIQHTAGLGITGSNISNLTIANNIIQNSASSVNSIQLTNVSGTLNLVKNSISNNQQVGVSVANTNINNAKYMLEDNLFKTTSTAVAMNNWVNCQGNTIELIDNEILASASGFTFSGTGAISNPNNILLTNNLFSSVGVPVNIGLTDGRYHAEIIRNKVFASGTSTLTSSGTAVADITIAKNEYRGGSATTLFTITTSGTSSMMLNMMNNDIVATNSGTGFNITVNGDTTNRSSLNLSLIENQIALDANSIIVNVLSQAGFFTGNIQGNTLMGGSAGVSVINGASGITACSIVDNQFSVCTTGITNGVGNGSGKYSIIGNEFNNCINAVTLNATNAGGTVCVNLEDNFAESSLGSVASPGAYRFNQTNGILNLEPTTGNVGRIVRVNPVTDVPDGFCD
jgi:hypothetical protein